MNTEDRPLVTFIIPSHKEGDLIRLTYETIKGELVKESIDNYEIIISDCNHPDDGGVEVGEALMARDNRVHYVRQDGCYNLGYHYAYGLKKARGEYFMMVPGDNETMGEAIGGILRARGKADIIISYTSNIEVRPLFRQIISRLYVSLCNTMFGLNLKYFNGLSLIKTQLLRSLLPLSEGFSYSTEIIVRLLKLEDRHTYVEVPMPIRAPLPGRRAAAFNFRNFVSVGKTLGSLALKVWIKYIPNISTRMALALILVVFLVPELVLWAQVDFFQEPIRSYRGDTLHYMTVLNRSVVSGGPEGNSFFFEEQEHGSRFFVFESLIGTVSRAVSIPTSVWAIVLQVLVPLIVFYVLYEIFRTLGINQAISITASLVHTLVYGVVMFDGYGLAFWFIPFLLLGLWVVFKTVTSETFSKQAGLMLVLSILLFTLHPAYFAFGGALTFTAWVMLIIKHGKRGVLPYAVSWFVLAVLTFVWLFMPMLASTVANVDLVTRMASVKSRYPIHPIQMLELLLVGLALLREKKNLILPLAFLIGFAALFAPTITGSYMVNDHYIIMRDYLVLAAALVLMFATDQRRNLWLGIPILLITIVDIGVVLNYFDFQLGYYGKYATVHAGFLVIAILLIRPDIKDKFKKLTMSKSLRAALVCLALLYAGLLQYKDTAHAHWDRDMKVQEFRSLIETLRELPPGVILASNEISLLIPVFTDHKIYWSSLASAQPAPTQNVLDRYGDTNLFFPDDSSHEPPAIADYLFGAIDKCREFYRGELMLWFAGKGLERPYIEVCAPTRVRKEKYDLIESDLDKARVEILGQKKWVPAYHLDYLVIGDIDEAVPTWLVDKYFSKVSETPNATIYRYKY